MRLSYVNPYSRTVHRRNAVAYARLAEDCGYHAVWMPEAFGSDVITVLGMVAGGTSRIRLATGIVNIFSRTPSLLAQTFATLDELSDGRAIIGLGTSGPIVIQNWHGMPFSKPLTRMRETVEIIRLALSGERVNYDGEVFKLSGFRMLIRPVQDRMPIYLATFKPKPVRLTGEIADGWLPTHVSVSRYHELRTELVAGATAAGRDPDELDQATLLLIACTDDGDTARDLCREHLAYYIGGMGTFYHELMHASGHGAVGDEIMARWQAGDRTGAAAAIPRDMLDDLVIAGTRAECHAALEARRKAGFRHIVGFPPHSMEPDQITHTLKALVA